MLVLIMLPIMTVTVLASSGIQIVSNALVSVNPLTHEITIHKPDGEVDQILTLTTTWPARGYVSDEFGAFELFRRENNLGPHTGTDIANNFGREGDPITTFAEGTIIAVHDKDDNLCGRYVKIDHGHNIKSLYCHMLEPTATLHAPVKPGDVIGRMGQTGAATGPHVHFQINIYDIPVNARTFVTGEPEPSTR